MGDLLSAASLLLAVLGMLYSLWYPEIQKALDLKLPKFEEDRVEPYKVILETFWTRSLPLAALALVDSLIFMPDTIKVMYKIYTQVMTSNASIFFRDYDSVGIAFCAVEIITIGIGIHVLLLSYRLLKLRFYRNTRDAKDKK